jgi:predicted RNA-binding Zn ribbon-like protein
MQSIQEMPFVAGHPALDFVNTAEERGHPEAGDVLLTPADLRLWGQRYGLLARTLRLCDDAPAELERAREARELLYVLFHARAHARPVRKPDLDRMAKFAVEAYRAAELEAADGGGRVHWHWRRSRLATVRHITVTSGLELLGGEPTPRLKQCPGEHCGWFFLDTTKRGNRRWCQMRECGQEAKDERRRERRRSANTGGTGSRSGQQRHRHLTNAVAHQGAEPGPPDPLEPPDEPPAPGGAGAAGPLWPD